MKLINKLKNPTDFYPILILLISVVLFITNYKMGTYLIGWDNVMPEFNPKLNFDRSFFSIWQEYRGLGVLDGLSHAANFFHTIYIYLLSFILPEAVLRYSYIHLMHFLGGLGFFFLTRKLTKNDKAAFIGSLFYMFNIGIVQMFFAPLEVFATHFAALPILALLITNALKKSTYRNILFLFLGSLFLSPQGFVPTVFIAFSILFGSMLIVNIIKTKRIKTSLVVFLTLVAANAFWAIPYTYSALNTAENIKNSRINQFTSEEIFFRNQSFGNLTSVIGLKGFMIDTIELNPETFENEYFMSKWQELTSTLYYQITYLAFLLLIGTGLIYSVIKRKTDFIPYLLTLSVAFVFLANDTLFLREINNIIRSTFPLIGEAFRFPFTKFITLFAFCLSVFLSLGISIFLVKFSKIKNLIFPLLIAGIIIISYPAFIGNFTSPFLRLSIPQGYLDLFDYMKKQDSDQRIALLPVQTFWNWQYRDWGQRGSGFIWHALPQPIFERAFDPWSPYDEQFYNEIAYAVNTQDKLLFENIIKKYDIKYFILDQHVINTLSRKQINYDSLKKFIESNNFITKEKEYGKIILYKTNVPKGFVYQLKKDSTKGVYPNYAFEKIDSIYEFSDNYITDTSSPSVVNLFPSLYSEKLQENLEFNVENKKAEYKLYPKINLSYDLSNYMLRIPSLFETEFLVPVEVSLQNNQLILNPVYPKIIVNNKELNLNEEPIIIDISENIQPDKIKFLETNQVINFDDENQVAYLLNPAQNSIELIDNEGNREVIYYDTENLQRKSFFSRLPEEKIKSVELIFPKYKSNQSANNIIKGKRYEINELDPGVYSKPYSTNSSKIEGNSAQLSAVDSSTELAFYLPDLYHQASYILFAKNKYQEGLPMRFYIDNDTEIKAEVEAVFSKTKEDTTIIIPKANNYFKGYGFHFIVKSVGKEKASSIISDIELYPFPSRFVRSLQFIDSATYSNPTNKNPKIPTEHRQTNTAFYETFTNPNSLLVLSQAYDEGWKAYELDNTSSLAKTLPVIFGQELKNHSLVNNWANGWQTKDGGTTVIIYIPTYLQFVGQFITIATLIFLISHALTVLRNQKAH